MLLIFKKKPNNINEDKIENSTNLNNNNFENDENFDEEIEDETISVIFEDKKSIFMMFGLFLIFIAIILLIYFKIN